MKPPPKVVVVGALHRDILVDAERQPERGETLIGQSWRTVLGGKGGNQAIAARKSGSLVTMISAVGRDAFGEDMLAELSSAGVDISAVVQDPVLGSGMSVAITDAEGDYAAVVVSGANRGLDPDTVVSNESLRRCDALILQNEVTEDVNRAAASMARSAGALIVWNAAPERPDTVALSTVVDVLIVNSIEARQMTGMDVDDLPSAERAARQIAETIPSVVVTVGAKGLVGIDPTGASVPIEGIPVTNPSSHGAGDVFTGTLASLLASGEPFGDALADANAAAASHVAGPDGSARS